MSLENKSSYFIVIPNGSKRNTGSGWYGEETILRTSTPFPPFLPVSILTLIILCIRSEGVLLFLVLLIHIINQNRMEINL